MKEKAGRFLGVVLAVVLVFATTPTFALAANDTGRAQEFTFSAQATNPTKVNEAVTKFADSLSKFVADTSKLSAISSALTRFGGVTSMVSGVLGILQMAGIIKDPTQAALGQILDEVHNIQDKLKEMDAKIDDLHNDLIKVAASVEEKDRNSKATTMMTNWDAFNTSYTEPLDDLMEVYQSKVNGGIKAWWQQSSHEGVYVLYAMQDGAPALTYSHAAYTDGLPEQADNEEAVDADSSFGIPTDYIPATASIAFNINTYHSEFAAEMAEKFVQAADEQRLVATDAFYTAWNALTADEKDQKAAAYAEDILNTQVYHVSCQVMTDEDEWVTGVVNAYRKYCDNVLSQNSGVNAMLNAMYLTHGFEGEIKDDIATFCDAMTAKAGVYGQFALACVAQDDLQSTTNRQAVQTLFADTVNSLYDKKDTAITGHDNYCYITGTLVTDTTVAATSKLELKLKIWKRWTGQTLVAYKGYNNTDWSATVPSIMDDVRIQVLYHQYQQQNEGTSSFAEYLGKYGTGYKKSKDYQKKIVTKYNGSQTFSLSDGIKMLSYTYPFLSYFGNMRSYNINSGNKSGVEGKYFHIHDKITGDMFNMESEKLEMNQLLGARALYGESHAKWYKDEAAIFHTDWYGGNNYDTHTGTTGSEDDENKTYYANIKVNMDVLKLQPIHALNGDADDETNPFYAFGGISFTDGVSDTIGPVAQDSSATITSVSLKKSSFAYTGKAVKPKLTVKAGGKTVPASGYKVTYSDNKDVGTCKVTVKGQGDYSGSIQKSFKIVPKGTAISKAANQGKTARVKWKKQAKSMSKAKVTGYQIRYSAKSSMKNAKKVAVKGYKKTTRTIKGLKKGKKYYFQVRTYVNTSKGNVYSKWSKKKVAR